MFGQSRESKPYPNSTNILERITDAEIFDYYLGGIPARAITSPLREDTKPSFSVFRSKDYDKLFFKDFGTGETGDCFLFVMRLFKLSTKKETFTKIASDFNLNDLETVPFMYTPPKQKNAKLYRKAEKIKSNRCKFSITVRDWDLRDKNYWGKKYGITRKQLEYCNVLPISHFFMDGSCIKTNDIAYAFVEQKDGFQSFKIYQPNAETEHKWYNNNDYSTWELWTQMPDVGEILIITSSRKDAIVIKSLFPTHKITSCSLQSEGVKPKQSVVDELKSRFKRIFVLYDNDFDSKKNTGRIAGAKISKSTGFTQIEIPDKFCTKDPSDFIEKYGAGLLTKLILHLVNKEN